ncbi:MAG: hypothetical protein EU544_03640, partial [Promethearchaeota archaeon]
MAKKKSNKNLLKATRELLEEYLEKTSKDKEIEYPEDTVKIDDLDKQETLTRIYEITDRILKKIAASGRPTIELPSRS